MGTELAGFGEIHHHAIFFSSSHVPGTQLFFGAYLGRCASTVGIFCCWHPMLFVYVEAYYHVAVVRVRTVGCEHRWHYGSSGTEHAWHNPLICGILLTLTFGTPALSHHSGGKRVTLANLR